MSGVICHQTKGQYFVLIASQNRQKNRKMADFCNFCIICDFFIRSSHLNMSIFASVDHDWFYIYISIYLGIYIYLVVSNKTKITQFDLLLCCFSIFFALSVVYCKYMYWIHVHPQCMFCLKSLFLQKKILIKLNKYVIHLNFKAPWNLTKDLSNLLLLIYCGQG